MKNARQPPKILCWIALLMLILSAQMTSAAKELTTLYLNFGSFTWQTTGDPKTDGVYVGETYNDVPEGEGTLTSPDRWKFIWGWKYVGEFRDGNPWNGTHYDKYGNVEGTASNGVWKAR